MTKRSEGERDFLLKSTIRAILWSQGYSTRLDVLLAYDKDTQGKNGPAKIALTDLDVLGIRLDPGFRIHTVVADCKTTTSQVPERLFWLSGVGKFFGSDTNLLVRSRPLPEHAPPLARSLDITLVGPDDLAILTNTYVNSSGGVLSQVWQDFFSPELLDEVLTRLSRLPSQLIRVERYRETGYWMEEPYRRLQQIFSALQYMSKDGSNGPIFHLVFADFVWLYVVALWEACEALNAMGLSRLERGLELYINGNEAGMRNIQRMKQSFETLARQLNEDVNLSLMPPYFKNLLEIIARCVRRPNAVSKMARRAEWLIIGQMVGKLGTPPWKFTDDDLIGSKLLGDIARFMVQVSGLKPSYLETYLDLLRDWDTERDSSEPPDMDLYTSVDLQTRQAEMQFLNPEVEQLSSFGLEADNTLEGRA
jgi:hypothetical protein